MTPSANRVIIQTIFKSVHIVFKAPTGPFTKRIGAKKEDEEEEEEKNKNKKQASLSLW